MNREGLPVPTRTQIATKIPRENLVNADGGANAFAAAITVRAIQLLTRPAACHRPGLTTKLRPTNGTEPRHHAKQRE
jgi:hypothetical protein